MVALDPSKVQVGVRIPSVALLISLRLMGRQGFLVPLIEVRILEGESARVVELADTGDSKSPV